jgi:hypothetical protein
LHRIGDHDVMWWSPFELYLDAAPAGGLRHADVIAKDVPAEVVEAGLAEYNAWRATRARGIESGSAPGILIQTVTRHAVASKGSDVDIEPLVLHVEANGPRPHGRRFGTLVHSVLASAPLDSPAATIRMLAASQGRTVGATNEEIDAAVERIVAAFAQPFFDRVRAAGSCRREVPIAWRTDDGMLLEGTVDLAFEEPAGWVVVDFKTDERPKVKQRSHLRQLELYSNAIAKATGRPVSGVLLYL